MMHRLYMQGRSHDAGIRIGGSEPSHPPPGLRTRLRPRPAAILCVALALLLAGGTRVGRAELMSDTLAPYADRIDKAVDRGLQHLVATQSRAGFFPGNYGRAPGVVSLAGMAFMAAGHTPGREPYGEDVNRCIRYVLSCQRDSGYITARQGRDRGMYSHNISTLFLSEASGMLPPKLQERVDKALPKAVKVIIAAQNVKKHSKHAGGWRYKPNSKNSDLSCSGWALMALRSARLNGARVPDENIERAVKYVLGNQHSGKGGFGYQKPGSRITLTGAAVLCLELSGYHGTKEMQKARQYMLNHFRALERERHRVYGLYYCAQGAFQLGGELWQQFASWMYERYLPKQASSGAWYPAGGTWGQSDKVTSAYSTSMTILSFTVPYRQLPIYQRDETVDDVQ